MTQDIWQKLGLDKPLPKATNAKVAEAPKKAVAQFDADLNDTALLLDAWDIDQGKKLLKNNHRIRQTNLQPPAVADFFAANFQQDPELSQGCVDSRRFDFIKAAMETSDYVALHPSTELNSTAAEIAAQEMAEQYAKLVQDDASRAVKPP